MHLQQKGSNLSKFNGIQGELFKDCCSEGAELLLKVPGL